MALRRSNGSLKLNRQIFPQQRFHDANVDLAANPCSVCCIQGSVIWLSFGDNLIRNRGTSRQNQI